MIHRLAGMWKSHTCYSVLGVENQPDRHYIKCMRKRTRNYMGTFPANVNSDNNKLYADLLQLARESNAILSELGDNRGRFVIRKRYRGPRVGKRLNGQSMCYRKDAVRCDAYLYFERDMRSVHARYA